MNNIFNSAKPVWIKGKETEVNCRVQFKAICEKSDNAQIKIATSGIYQLWINGSFVSYGPARAGRNKFRAENIDISSYLTADENIVVIEVAGYYCTSFYIMRQPSFLQAEIVCGDKISAATGRDFSARINPNYIQKIQRYSYQRTFAESYNNVPQDGFFTNLSVGGEELSVCEDKNIIERYAPYPDFESLSAEAIRCGTVEKKDPAEYTYDRYVLQVGMNDGENTGWKEENLDFLPEKEYQKLLFTEGCEKPQGKISENHYNLYEFPYNATGMISFDVTCEKSVTLCLGFDEIMIDGKLDPRRCRVCNIIFYKLPAGKHHIQTFEVYTLKYLQIAALDYGCTVENVKITEYKHPKVEVPVYDDLKLQKIADAAVETYRQNAVDIFTDCPLRERAGWLCDSFFLARAEQTLTGKNTIEESFLENFLHEDFYEKLPCGMLPMCYPSDSIAGSYIPNWAMWLVVELEDYYKRTGKRELIDRFRDKVYALVEFFKDFENSDGLLENLNGWIFVEWSRANDSDMVSGINYPSNMMYYMMLKAVAHLYNDRQLPEKAEKIRKNILKQSFDGEFFVDHADRNENGVCPVSESTEVCQYYAFFTGVATPETHKELFDKMITRFGPHRDIKSCYPKVSPAAPFIGDYLRLQILTDFGFNKEVTEDIKEYFYGMAEQTGTLWEMANPTNSCNHGFASCVLYWLENIKNEKSLTAQESNVGCKIINSYEFGDITARYILNGGGRAVLLLLPKDSNTDIFSPKNAAVYNDSSLVHLQLSCHNAGMLSNSFKLSESLYGLKFKEQYTEETDGSITVVTVEEAEEGYGIRHRLCWYKGENGFEVNAEFYNKSGKELELEFITSASLDALSPCLDDEGSKKLVFHRFKAGWSMEGLHQANTLTELGLERAWATSAESLKFGAVGTRSVREYHPYGAVEDTKNNITWGVYLAHNASWQMELTRKCDGVSLSIGLADSMTGLWSKKIPNGGSFKTPTAMVSVAVGGIAELSNRLISMRNRAIDAYGEQGMPIVYNEFVTTWGKPSEKAMLNIADILSRGKTKYLVIDGGWYRSMNRVGDWEVNPLAFPNGMKAYTDKIREKGFVPGIWFEFECAEAPAKAFGPEFDGLKLKKNGKVIVGEVINGRRENFFDFRNPEAIKYLEEKVIKFLRDNGFGYIKVDYNTSPGIGVDGEDSPGENLRQHMEGVRNFFIKMKKEIPDLIIENCASGGCRLEPSMMDISAMSSASDTHEGYECAVVAANLHYLTPPRQNQIWCTLKPDYSKERFSYIISEGFLGRMCWSGLIAELSEEQLDEMFRAEKFYERVSPIIKRGNSYIYRTDICSFHSPTGTQTVVRYSEDGDSVLVVCHGFKDAEGQEIELKNEYVLSESLYSDGTVLEGNRLKLKPLADFSGNVFLLERKNKLYKQSERKA